MKKLKWILGIIAVILVAVVAGLALKLRSAAPKGGSLMIETENRRIVIRYDKLDNEQFAGEIINGKGEVSNTEYRGTELSDLFQDNGIEITEDMVITAVSEDNYKAELTGAEIMTPDQVYIAVSADGKMIESIDGGQGAQLVVYGDANAKRQVRYLKTINVK